MYYYTIKNRILQSQINIGAAIAYQVTNVVTKPTKKLTDDFLKIIYYPVYYK